MNTRYLVVAIAAIALGGFAASALVFQRPPPVSPVTSAENISEESILERLYSPSFGPADAPVTVVEFFDPVCEACRAFHPTVKAILAKYPEDVRVVLRYTPFHDSSEEIVRLLEAARMQDVYEPVLEAILETQPKWARHGSPQIELAYQAAAAAGLDVEKARKFMQLPDITSIVLQDMAEVKSVGVRGTPTFFVNGKPLPEFGQRQLVEFVDAEVAAARTKSRQ